MKTLLLLLGTTAALAADAPLLKDDFSAPKLEQRRASRGDWKFADNTATCTQDDALYKKNKDHGPILFYDLAHTDAAIRFAVKPDASTKTIVFTANGADGHVFRIVLSSRGAGIRAFPPGEKDHKSISLGNEPTVLLKPGEWTAVTVDLRGPKAAVRIGDFSQTYEHASLSRPKTNLSIGFSFGTICVKDLVVEK
jgi:hypothetical protein|uniref:hypothetical protein n=1 Tax=Prosthecobacter sp. TaxID=1965333 RepID=UPI003783745C